jgi:hypothetical protein
MRQLNIPWGRLITEVSIIVASVFVAISLENMWQNRSESYQAKIALSQLLQELRADQIFLDQVWEEQKNIQKLTNAFLSWFSSPNSLPADEVNLAITKYTTPLSMWPRRAAWTTMVASGQLTLLDDQKMLVQLGKHFEYTQPRLIYNGENYDDDFDKMKFEYFPQYWNADEMRLITLNPDKIAQLRSQLRFINDWTEWYLDFLVTYENDLDLLVGVVEQYLIDDGIAVE